MKFPIIFPESEHMSITNKKERKCISLTNNISKTPNYSVFTHTLYMLSHFQKIIPIVTQKCRYHTLLSENIEGLRFPDPIYLGVGVRLPDPLLGDLSPFF